MAGILGRFTKQSTETLDYQVSFDDWMGERTDTAISFAVVVESGITLLSSSRTGNVVTVVLAGGTSGAQYKVTVRLQTDGGIVKEADFIVKVKDV